jgi:hypothetical protein
LLYDGPIEDEEPEFIPLDLDQNERKKGFKFNWYFEIIIMILIMLNSVMLAFDSPLLDPNSPKHKFITNANKSFTIAFTIEVSMRVIA